MAHLYQVIFNGALTGEHDLAESKLRFSRLFKLDSARTERYFSGRDVILKKNISEAEAMDYAIKLVEAGCECFVELMPDPDDPTLQPGFVERRKTVRRRRFRRPPRAGAIVPDRRELPSRRKQDLIQLEKYGTFPGETVKPKKK